MIRGRSKLGCGFAAGLAFFLVGLCLPWASALTEAPARLAFGWLPFLRRTLPRVSVSPSGVTTFAVLLAVFAAVVHLLGRRAFAGGEAARGRWSGRSTAASCGLLVVLFAAGVAATGAGHQAGWMLRSPVPLVRSGRDVVYRSQSQLNLKQIGLALHNYHSNYERFPAGGTYTRSGRGRHGWATRLLPFLDRADLADRVAWDEPWDAPANRPVFAEPLEPLASPYRELPAVDPDGLALAHYAGNSRVLTDELGLRLDDIPDGTTETLLAGEVAAGFLPWGRPANARDPLVGFGDPAGFGAPRDYGVQFLMADGSVHLIQDSIDPGVWEALATPAGGEEIGDGF